MPLKKGLGYRLPNESSLLAASENSRLAGMGTDSRIRLLEADPNKRGDLFGRLMGDLFLALGYDDARLNIHNTGRACDLQATHRTEKRRVVA